MTLAHEGAAAFRDRYELIHRHRAGAANAIWQADHTMLDLLIIDEAGKPARPWLTTVVDDHSRAVAGAMVFLGAPSILNTSLALRQAIWRKADPSWPVCGIPDALYVDHGSDFTSNHLDQVAASLRFRIIYSAVARPQGRGKIERLFGTLNSELLPELPGHLVNGKPATAPCLSLAELDRAITVYITSTYHARVHGETGETPLDAWRSNGAAALRQAFIQPDRAQASQVLRHVADQVRKKWPKLAALRRKAQGLTPAPRTAAQSSAPSHATHNTKERNPPRLTGSEPPAAAPRISTRLTDVTNALRPRKSAHRP